MALDFDQGDFLLALEVDYKLPESGLLLDVHAAEVFYGHRPGDWHLAIGWPEPISRQGQGEGTEAARLGRLPRH